MKKLIESLILLIFSSFSLVAQERPYQNFQKAKLKNAEVGTFLAENTSFPFSVDPSKNIQEQVIVNFIITKNGEIDSVKLLNSPNKQFAFEALSALDKCIGLWIPSKVDDQPINKEFQVVFNFTTTESFFNYKDKALKLQHKGEYEKALQSIDKAFKINAYDKDLYQARSIIYKNLNKPELAEKDIDKIKELDGKLLADIWITVIGIPRRGNSL